MFELLNKNLFGKNIMPGRNCTKSRIAGNTLITTLFFMLALALIGKPAMDFYDAWRDKTATAQTRDRLAAIDKAVRNYVTAKGRYPYPADMRAQFDTAAFGIQAEPADCQASATAPVVRSIGQGGGAVCAGAVPVRTLGLPDDAIYDGYGHRYVYTVTEDFAVVGANVNTARPAIILRDDGNRLATEEEGNIVFAITSFGRDEAGAHNKNGVLLAPCSTTGTAGENCDMDATLVNTVQKSYADNNQKFTQSIRFKTSKPCANVMDVGPQKMAYLLDSSTSMRANFTTCPPNYSGNCIRMDAAHWALRRAMVARQTFTAEEEEASTAFVGFIGNNPTRVQEQLQSESLNVTREEDVVSRVNNTCFNNGGTPLGMHLSGLMTRIGPGTESRPNAVLVLSDGNNNQGRGPVEEIRRIFDEHPDWEGKINVHIVDISTPAGLDADDDVPGNPALVQAAEMTGGEYFQTRDPEEMLKWMMELSGTCENTGVDAPVDALTCRGDPRNNSTAIINP